MMSNATRGLLDEEAPRADLGECPMRTLRPGLWGAREGRAPRRPPQIGFWLRDYHSSEEAVWYSVTRVSKKFFSFCRSIVSLIQGKGLREP